MQYEIPSILPRVADCVTVADLNARSHFSSALSLNKVAQNSRQGKQSITCRCSWITAHVGFAFCLVTVLSSHTFDLNSPSYNLYISANARLSNVPKKNYTVHKSNNHINYQTTTVTLYRFSIAYVFNRNNTSPDTNQKLSVPS
jgi:hypothetical protein